MYVRPDGSVIGDRHTLSRIRSLVIPPAWKRVWICERADGHLQASAGRDPNTTSVREVMTAETIAICRPEQSVDDAVAVMRRYEVRRLPVLDKQDRLVGLVALADLAQHTDERTSGKAVRAVSQPTETQQT